MFTKSIRAGTFIVRYSVCDFIGGDSLGSAALGHYPVVARSPDLATGVDRTSPCRCRAPKAKRRPSVPLTARARAAHPAKKNPPSGAGAPPLHKTPTAALPAAPPNLKTPPPRLGDPP